MSKRINASLVKLKPHLGSPSLGVDIVKKY